MKKKKNSSFPLRKEKDSFILRLNKKLYNSDFLSKAISEDRGWVKEIPAADGYFSIKCYTLKIEDVLRWLNYLIYLHKV